MIRAVLIVFALLASATAAQAQGYQCPTPAVGASSPFCASEAFVTKSRGTLTPTTFASLPACASGTEGTTADVSDSTTNIVGQTITGGGSDHVLAYCSGSNWIVAGGALPTIPGGTVTEQKNTFGYGLSSSGNCDNTSTNASSPCNAAVSLSTASNVLSANKALNNTSTYFDGPSMAQGVTGTWFASGTVTITDSTAAQIFCKLWDGTTVIASSDATLNAGTIETMALSGFLAAPAGNLRISCRDSTNTTGSILFNQTGNSKDSSIYGFRLS